MSARLFLALTLSAAVCFPVMALAGDGSDKKSKDKASAETALTCPVSGDPASETVFADYRGAKVYLRCKGCKGKFEEDSAKFATKANYQLVSTGQAKQIACPLSGRPAKNDVVAKVGNVKVGLCCNGCKSAIDKAEGDKQLEVAFGNKAFEKGFQVKVKKEKKKKS